MPSTRLLLLAIGVTALLAVLVLGAAFDALRQSFRGRSNGSAARPPENSPTTASRPDPRRYTAPRTRLRWFSPEIAAVLLLALAAGLWLARLA